MTGLSVTPSRLCPGVLFERDGRARPSHDSNLRSTEFTAIGTPVGGLRQSGPGVHPSPSVDLRDREPSGAAWADWMHSGTRCVAKDGKTGFWRQFSNARSVSAARPALPLQGQELHAIRHVLRLQGQRDEREVLHAGTDRHPMKVRIDHAGERNAVSLALDRCHEQIAVVRDEDASKGGCAIEQLVVGNAVAPVLLCGKEIHSRQPQRRRDRPMDVDIEEEGRRSLLKPLGAELVEERGRPGCLSGVLVALQISRDLRVNRFAVIRGVREG